MSHGKKPTRELTIQEIINQTFATYSAKFLQYLIPFLTAGALTGAITMNINDIIRIPQAPSPIIPNPTTEEIQKWLPQFSNYITATLTIAALTITTWWIVTSMTSGIATKFTADTMEKEIADLKTSLNYTTAKLFPLLTISIITALLITLGPTIVAVPDTTLRILFSTVLPLSIEHSTSSFIVLGFIVFAIPATILSIMFSLLIPTIVIENLDTLKSIERSHQLISHKWLITFILLLFLYIIVGTVTVLMSIISMPFGEYSPLISSTLSAFILPILPIGLTLHYYSTIARSS